MGSLMFMARVCQRSGVVAALIALELVAPPALGQTGADPAKRESAEQSSGPPGSSVPATLQPEATLELELTSTGPADVPASQFVLVAASTGSLTIEARSFDDDVVLSRLADDGSVDSEADEGGLGWNARLLVEARADERLRLRVSFKRALTGRVIVEARAEPDALPEGFALGEATAKWLLGRASAAEARGDVLDAADAYHQAGQTFFNLGLLSDSRLAYLACRPLAEATGNPVLKMVVPGFLGAVAVGFGRPEEARGLLEAGRDAAVTLQHAPFEQFCQSKLGEAYAALGRLADARIAVDRALLITRALGDRPNEAGLLAQDAALRELEGDSAAARDLYLAARTVATEIGDHERLAHVSRIEGQSHRRRGEWEQADRAFEDALSSTAAPAVRAAVLGEQGNLCLDRGQWERAHDLYSQALDLARELGDAGLEAAAVENLGVLAYRVGDFDEASARLHSVIDGPTATDPATEVRVRAVLASVEFERGRLDLARRELNRALERATAFPSDGLAFGVLNQLALLEAEDPSGLSAAEEHARQLVEVAREGASREQLAQGLSMAAWVAHLRGQQSEAQALIEQALVEIASGVAPHVAASVQSTRLEIALARRDLPAVRAALADSRALLAMAAAGSDVESASLARATWSVAVFPALEQDAIALELSQVDAAGSARAGLVADGFQAASRSQGRALLEGIAEQRSGRRSDEIVRLRHERQRALADRDAAFAALGVARRDGWPEDSQRRLRETARRAEGEAGELLDSLRAKSPGDAELDHPSALTPGAVQRELLSPGDVFIQYADGKSHLYCYTISRDAITWTDLGERDLILDRVGELLEGMSDPAKLAPADQIARRGSAAWASLLQPLALADTTRRLIVVPTPGLAALPFEALVVSASDTPKSFADMQFVLDRFEVDYSPSASIQSLLASIPPRRSEPRLLVLADPVVPGETASPADVPRRRPELLPLLRLPGTRVEALAIVDLLHSVTAPTEPVATLAPDQRGGCVQAAGIDVYLGESATESRLREDPQRYSIVHIAAHGAVDGSDPRRSGLVLSASGDDDGFLTVAEVLDLDLDADLVVLSACDTARGAVRRGEGVQSVARAFLYAGSRGVVATLWQVDDRETEAVMRSFYKALTGTALTGTHRPPAEALRQARLEVRRAPPKSEGFLGVGRGEKLPGAPERKRAPGRAGSDLAGHPYFWAPFITIAGAPASRSR